AAKSSAHTLIYERFSGIVHLRRDEIETARCPDFRSVSSGRTGIRVGAQMLSQLRVGAAAMRDRILLFVRHLRERLLRALRQEPGIPAEMTLAARRDQHLTRRLAVEDVTVTTVPVRDATLRFGGAVVQRVRDRGESLSAGRFEQPLHIRTRKIAELVEAKGDVLDDEAVVALRAGDFELVAGDVLDRRR